jgi:hypothetical protein
MPEQVHRHVTLRRADEHPWHEAPAIESAHVCVLRMLVPGPTGHVRKQLIRHRRLSPALNLGERKRKTFAHSTQAAKVNLELIVTKVWHLAIPLALRIFEQEITEETENLQTFVVFVLPLSLFPPVQYLAAMYRHLFSLAWYDRIILDWTV